jgi:hypothetical protein
MTAVRLTWSTGHVERRTPHPLEFGRGRLHRDDGAATARVAGTDHSARVWAAPHRLAAAEETLGPLSARSRSLPGRWAWCRLDVEHALLPVQPRGACGHRQFESVASRFIPTTVLPPPAGSTGQRLPAALVTWVFQMAHLAGSLIRRGLPPVIGTPEPTLLRAIRGSVPFVTHRRTPRHDDMFRRRRRSTISASRCAKHRI